MEPNYSKEMMALMVYKRLMIIGQMSKMSKKKKNPLVEFLSFRTA